MGFGGFWRALAGFAGLRRALAGFIRFIRFYPVLSGFIRFYPVLSGFIGFYPVLSGFILLLFTEPPQLGATAALLLLPAMATFRYKQANTINSVFQPRESSFIVECSLVPAEAIYCKQVIFFCKQVFFGCKQVINKTCLRGKMACLQVFFLCRQVILEKPKTS